MLFMKYHWVNQSIYVISEEEQSIYSCYWLNNNNNINIDSTLQKFDTPEINLNNWLLSKTLAVAYILNIVFEQMAINFACFSEIVVFSLFFLLIFRQKREKVPHYLSILAVFALYWLDTWFQKLLIRCISFLDGKWNGFAWQMRHGRKWKLIIHINDGLNKPRPSHTAHE